MLSKCLYLEVGTVRLNLQAVIQDFLQCCNLTVQVIFSECNHKVYAVCILYQAMLCKACN